MSVTIPSNPAILDKLVDMYYADMFSEGKFFVITMRYTQPFEQNKNEALFTKDEQRFVRWLSDYISVEEMLSSGVDSLKDTDKLFKPQMSDGKANTWKRLNQFISRIILRHSNFIPE